MISTAMKTKGAIDRNSLSSINKIKVQGAMTSSNISTLNQPETLSQPQRSVPASTGTSSHSNTHTHPSGAAPSQSQHTQNVIQSTVAPPVQRSLPPLTKQIRKGQKVPLNSGMPLENISACFGWNTSNSQCDVDVSAFLLGADDKVLGDSWFVFYGQTTSPDKSCTFQPDDAADREIIQIDFKKLNADVKKIVFVLTINDAFSKKLNFGMLKDAYVRILQEGQTELVSFKMSDYYDNVISMMIGEIYEYNGTWKFNAVGNGVARDLAGLCALYGVQVSD